MNVKIITMSDSAIQLQIDGVDYCVSDIIHKELLGVRHVKFAGVAPPHPLIKIITIQIHTDGSSSPKELVREAIRISQKRTGELLDTARQTFPDAMKFSGPSAEGQKNIEQEAAVRS